MNNKQDLIFMSCAVEISFQSKDPNTKVGACIVNELNEKISIACNNLPIGINNLIESRFDKDNKTYYIEHAERSAIYFCCKNGIATNNATNNYNLICSGFASLPVCPLAWPNHF